MAKNKSKVKIQRNFKTVIFYKNKKIILISGVSFIIALFIIIPIFLISTMNYSYVAKVTGEPIQKKEFLRQLNLERTTTFEYFKQKYNAEINENFWNTDFKGEVPINYARDKALTECINTKMQQIIAKKYGIVDDITYSKFLKDLLEENMRRENSVKNNQIIYGPKKYDENSYYIYVFSNLILKLKEKLAESEYKPTDIQLMGFYEKVKGKLYKQEADIKYKIIYISYSQQDGTLNDADRNAANETMNNLKVLIDKGKSFEDVAKSDPQKIKVEERTINNSTASSFSKVEPKLFETVKKLGVNQISDVLDEVNQRKIEIISLSNIDNTGYKSFNEVKDSVQLNYIDEKYNELLEKLKKEAKVEINKGLYNKVYPN